MPTPAQITVDVLRTQIKKESRVSGSDNLDDYILDLINELLLDYIEKNHYYELLIPNSPITTIAATGNYPLPASFYAERLVRYQSLNGSPFTLRKRNEYLENARGRMPRYYEVNGTNLTIFPSDDVPAGDTVLLDYYKYPNVLITSDVFPIPRLLPTLKLRAIHRVLLYNNNIQQAQAFRGEALEMDYKVRPNSDN